MEGPLEFYALVLVEEVEICIIKRCNEYSPLSDTPTSKVTSLVFSADKTPPFVNTPAKLPYPSFSNISYTSVPPSGPGLSASEDVFVTKNRAEEAEEHKATETVRLLDSGRVNVNDSSKVDRLFRESCCLVCAATMATLRRHQSVSGNIWWMSVE